jgi:3'-5' exonuclease
MTFTLDIETIPNLTIMSRMPAPEVKLGNLKDPEKIAEKQAEAREKQIADMGLSPLTARVLCAGVFNDDGAACKIMAEQTDDEERELLDWIFTLLAKPEARIVSWNGKGFDLPFLFRRAALLQLPVNCPPLDAWARKYDESRHVDLMKVWDNYAPGTYTSLETFASLALDGHKAEISFSEFPELIKTEAGRERITGYCLQDCALTWQAFKLMRGLLF